MPTAVVLPGRSYGHGPRQAGLYLARMALERAGFELVLVEWPDDGMPADLSEAAGVVAEIAAPLLAAGPDYLLATSLGTLAAPLAAAHGVDAVWLTPLLDEPVCRDAILAHPGRQLLVGGDRDRSWDHAAAEAAARHGAEVAELPGADHGFLVEGDPAATALTLVGVVAAVVAFVGR